MKVPSEGELIEIENRMARIINHCEFLMRKADPYSDWPEVISKFREDFRLLVALVRDPAKLLRSIPDDDAVTVAIHPPRTSVPELSPSVRPKRKKTTP